MRIEDIQEAVKEARSFIEKSGIALDIAFKKHHKRNTFGKPCFTEHGAMENSALRRKSMDLTRALAKMRKP